MPAYRKYFLVEPDKYEELISCSETKEKSNRNDLLTHPNVKTLTEIDSKMSNILKDESSTDVEKLDDYTANLDGYMRNYRNAIQVPKREAVFGNQLQITSEGDPKLEKNEDNPVQLDRDFLKDAVAKVPASYLPRAQQLSDYLKSKADFEITESGKLKYHGKDLFEADVAELLDGVVRKRSVSDNKARELDKFVSILKNSGYPINKLPYQKKRVTSSKITPRPSPAKTPARVKLDQKVTAKQKSRLSNKSPLSQINHRFQPYTKKETALTDTKIDRWVEHDAP